MWTHRVLPLFISIFHFHIILSFFFFFFSVSIIRHKSIMKSRIQIIEIMNKMFLNKWTTYTSYSHIYSFSMLFLNINLNLFNNVHVFSPLLQLFHKVTSLTVIQWYFVFVLTRCFLEYVGSPQAVPIFSQNNSWILLVTISFWLYTQFELSTKSLNFRAVNLINNGFVVSL